MRVRVSRKADADLDEIWLYIAERSGVLPAQTVVEQLTQAFGILASDPDLGRSREDIRPGLRSIPQGSYRIYDQRFHGYISIVRVLHAARDERKQF